MNKEHLHTFDLVSISEKIRTTRRAMDLTQSQLCELVNNDIDNNVKLSQREISQLEKGTGNATLSKIEAIAKALGKEWILSDLS